MSGSEKNQPTSRRGFLKAAAVTAVAATTVGGGAVLLKEQRSAENSPAKISAFDSPNQPINAVPVNAAQQAPSAAQTIDNSEVFKQLAAAQAENVRLQTELANAQNRIAMLEGNVASGSDETTTLRAEIAAAGEKIGVLGGLVALYETLDTPDLSEAVSNGLTEVGASVNELMDEIPSVSESLQLGRDALNGFEAEIPLVDGGRKWLLAHVDRIKLYYEAVEAVLESAADVAGPFLQMLTGWFEKIMQWLPFGLGSTTANLMDAMVTLLGETPSTISGTLTNVAQPLELWLGKADEPDFPVLTRVIQPMRDQVLTSSENALAKASSVHEKYNAKLARPATDALARHDVIRDSIQAYRQEHQI